MNEMLPTFACELCKHTWHPRKPGRPTRCPACLSPYWGVKDLNEGLAYLLGMAEGLAGTIREDSPRSRANARVIADRIRALLGGSPLNERTKK